jgi:peptidoglycan L-alanyl-D-glutamate endopeptidase CwlK
MYELAATMVPRGVGKLVQAKGKRANGSESDDSPIRQYLPSILKALNQRGIADIDMLLMALATIRAEASGFRPLSEGMYGGWWKNDKYTHGNTTMKKDPSDSTGRKETKTPVTHPFDVYDFMNGNQGSHKVGDTDVWDGQSYRGRGFVQLTGRARYQELSDQIFHDDTLVKDPDRANDPDIAAAILAQFLKNKESGIREALKWGNMSLARQKINGGTNGLTDFTTAFNAGRKFLHLSAIKKVKHLQAKKAPHAKQAAHAAGAAHAKVPAAAKRAAH